MSAGRLMVDLEKLGVMRMLALSAKGNLSNVTPADFAAKAAAAGVGATQDVTAEVTTQLATQRVSILQSAGNTADSKIAAAATNYAPVTHTHAAYALTTHNHTGTYAPVVHNHDAAYAPANHTHPMPTTANLSNISLANGGQVLLGDATDIVGSTSGRGIMYGTAPNQKQAFWGATPIVRPVVSGPLANVTIAQILTLLDTLGLIDNQTT